MPTGTAIIKNGQVIISKVLLEKFKDIDDGMADVTITIINKPEHYLYKYLHGYVIKDMALHVGETHEDAYWNMKETFAKYKVESWLDVPRRQRKYCQRIIESNPYTGAETKYYVASGKGMTHEELKEFTQKVEQHFMVFLGGCISPKTEKEALELREIGWMDAETFKEKVKNNELPQINIR